jgi:hypothetical protein
LSDEAVDLGAMACSFTGDTEVLMVDGTHKPIEDIKIGEQVRATDPETGESGAGTITTVWHHLDTVLDLAAEGGTVVTTTEDHPFWNVTDPDMLIDPKTGEVHPQMPDGTPGDSIGNIFRLSPGGAVTEELDDRWILGLRGSPVVSVSQPSEYQGFVLMLYCGAGLTIRGPAHLTYGPATAPGVGPLPDQEWQRLVGATVVSAIAFKSGALRVVFSTGHHLNFRGEGPEIVIHVQRPEEFDWSYQGGVGVMRVFGTTAS